MARAAEPTTPEARPNDLLRLKELAAVFLRLGTTAFGGPAAHIAMMEEEVVGRRSWLSHAEFLDMLAMTNFIPGPNSTEMAIHVGYRRAGLRGLLIAGASFILPAALMVATIAWAYVRFGKMPQAAAILYGIKPVVIAVVAQALWRLARVAVRTRFLVLIALASTALNLLGLNELLVLFGAGTIVAAVRWALERHDSGIPPASVSLAAPPLLKLSPATGVAASGAAAAAGLWPLFLVFLKVGSVLFGSGYVLLAFLRADLVDRHHWLTEAQLLDATAVGQVTPGPVFTTATFIGYILGGPKGAAIATVGIFLPAFFFVALSGPVLPRLRRSRLASAFLDGLNVASLALMAVVTWQLGRAALVDVPTILLAIGSAAVLLLTRINSAWVVLGGGIAGTILLRS